MTGLNQDYMAAQMVWAKMLSNQTLVELVREYRKGSRDIANVDALGEYTLRTSRKTFPADMLLSGRCGIHQGKRQRPKKCIKCAEFDELVKERKSRAKQGRRKKAA